MYNVNVGVRSPITENRRIPLKGHVIMFQNKGDSVVKVDVDLTIDPNSTSTLPFIDKDCPYDQEFMISFIGGSGDNRLEIVETLITPKIC